MNRKTACAIVVAGLTLWGLGFAAFGIVPWSALPFLVLVGAALFLIVGLLAVATDDKFFNGGQ